ncbi:hypothetical protein B0H10DRAFT_1967884 [Mycena sp. CBHHK59/15]|nr:hypothetical protein B0H10DRAFT_1967884 [Mycena sp. CBHHK59/15]
MHVNATEPASNGISGRSFLDTHQHHALAPRPINSTLSTMSSGIVTTTLDRYRRFGAFLDGTDNQAVANKMLASFKNIGFVYLLNHGIPPEWIARRFSPSKEFFAQPTEVKMLAPHPPSGTHHRGTVISVLWVTRQPLNTTFQVNLPQDKRRSSSMCTAPTQSPNSACKRPNTCISSTCCYMHTFFWDAYALLELHVDCGTQLRP